MANIKITEKVLENLRLKTNIAYVILKATVEIPEPKLLDSAKSLYKHDLGEYLLKLVLPTRHIELLNKGGKRAEKLEEFISQYVLMVNPSQEENGSYRIKVSENTNDDMGGLRAYIDAKDDLTSGEGEVFRLIARKAEELRNAQRYDLILRALDYVRENYSSSDKIVGFRLSRLDC